PTGKIAGPLIRSSRPAAPPKSATGRPSFRTRRNGARASKSSCSSPVCCTSKPERRSYGSTDSFCAPDDIFRIFAGAIVCAVGGGLAPAIGRGHGRPQGPAGPAKPGGRKRGQTVRFVLDAAAARPDTANQHVSLHTHAPLAAAAPAAAMGGAQPDRQSADAL